MNQPKINVRSIGKKPINRNIYADGEFTRVEQMVPTWIITHNRNRIGVIRETWHPKYSDGSYYKKLTVYCLKKNFTDLEDYNMALGRYESIKEVKADMWFYYELRSIQISISHIRHPEWGHEENIRSMSQFVQALSRVTDISDIKMPSVYGVVLRNDSAMRSKTC